MSIIIDLVGSVLIAATVILIGMTVSRNLAGSSEAAVATLNVQESLVDIVQSVEYDFRKVGYRVVNPKTSIVLADSNRIMFQSDIDNDGVVDQVEWFIGPKLTYLPNPNIRGLYRKINSAAAGGAPGLGVTAFSLKYFDQDGVSVSILSPIPSSLLSRISIIEMTIRLESPYKVADQVRGYDEMAYATAFWRQTRIATRNIKRHG